MLRKPKGSCGFLFDPIEAYCIFDLKNPLFLTVIIL